MRTQTRLRPVVYLAWTVAALCVIAPTLLAVTFGDTHLGSNIWEVMGSLLFVLLGPIYTVTGALILTRRPDNSVGWMLQLIGFGAALAVASDVAVPNTPPAELTPVLWTALVLASVAWVFFIFPVFHLLFVFPTGRLLSKRWRCAVALEILFVVLMLAFGAFSQLIESPSDPVWTVANPIGFLPGSAFPELFFNVGLLCLSIGGLVSVVVRFRRSRSPERQQMKVFLFAVILFAGVYAVGVSVDEASESSANDLLIPLSIVGVGIAIAVALLRYRLYDIDRVISRTVTYALVVGLLAAVFAGLVTMVGTQISEEPIFVAAATLGVASLFNPLRRRVQTGVERRFNRSRYDVERVMTQFTLGLRERIDPDALVDGWREVVVDTMQPSSLGLWMRR